ncbi:MAG: glycine betaine ABC transporter substrate-binding protein [Erysipelotrichaceae bacterium]|nr:glycine betaine ABC transporter substrate-binding protein [Erysipelotrichaceae bacterium]MDD3923922.1 glycine betaine ABC transporter substrate-binding protein [Erysipelotrichaceae bacterium]MDD4642701.1 glycine betaine ABC transporter substrate-binding protein [Erysipelotrichaceae bacterium]
MKKKIYLLLISLFLLISTAACSGNEQEEGPVINMYDGTYAEIMIINQMVKQLVEEYTDATVVIRDGMTLVNQFKEMQGDNPSNDLFLTYDGSTLASIFNRNPSDVPEGMTLFEYTRQVGEEEYGVTSLDKIGINNTYAIAVTRETAEKYNLEKVSDLIPIADELVFGAEPSFFSEETEDRYYAWVDAYGIEFKDAVSIDVNLKYTAIVNGNFDVTEVYSTDGLNKKYDLVILEEDLGFFPDYYANLVARKGFFEDFAEIENLYEVLDMLTGQITDAEMVEMSYAVDVEGKTPAEVANTFLVEKGLLD